MESYCARLGEITRSTERKTDIAEPKFRFPDLRFSRFLLLLLFFFRGGPKHAKIILRVSSYARQENLVPTPFQSLKLGYVFITLESELRK